VNAPQNNKVKAAAIVGILACVIVSGIITNEMMTVQPPWLRTAVGVVVGGAVGLYAFWLIQRLRRR
jgi:uncharacterized membrane protein AbrB (regulator of aidB expression)